MEDFFIIPENKIDPAWNPPDRSLELFVLDYCEEVLNIPLFVIEDSYYTDEGVEIELKNLEDWMIGEDWYINLFRLSNYAKAS
ncbi:hypothetical protein [Sulfurovum sp.]|uniref:hypothetical protein n=1 Tax=Sulfurovum sp. TaxID=1969726 RepID=UPI0025EED6B7|nr:hypothetical protein [Sulfurovum sp.]